MANGNPQVEDGYIRIAKELFEAITKIRFPGEAGQVFNAIILKTYGWQKKSDWISLSQFSQMTGLKKPNVVRGIKILLDMNVIIKSENTYAINKIYDTWKPLAKKSSVIKKDNSIIESDNVIENDNFVIENDKTFIENDNASLSKTIHTKDTNTKYTFTKDNTPQKNSAGDVSSPKPKAKNHSRKSKHNLGYNPIGIFYDIWRETFTNSPDPKLLKQHIGNLTTIAKTMNEDDYRRVVKGYLSENDPFIVKSGYSVSHLPQRMNKYLMGAADLEVVEYDKNGNRLYTSCEGYKTSVQIFRIPTEEDMEVLRRPL